MPESLAVMLQRMKTFSNFNHAGVVRIGRVNELIAAFQVRRISEENIVMSSSYAEGWSADLIAQISITVSGFSGIWLNMDTHSLTDECINTIVCCGPCSIRGRQIS